MRGANFSLGRGASPVCFTTRLSLIRWFPGSLIRCLDALLCLDDAPPFDSVDKVATMRASAQRNWEYAWQELIATHLLCLLRASR